MTISPPPDAKARQAHQDTSSLTSGAYGREIYFRPNRYEPAALAPLVLRVRVPYAIARASAQGSNGASNGAGKSAYAGRANDIAIPGGATADRSAIRFGAAADVGGGDVRAHDVEVRLRNLSQSGLGVVWPELAELPEDGEVLRGIVVLVDGRVFARVDAKVCSLQPGRVVGLELQGSLLRIDGLLAAQRVAIARDKVRSERRLHAGPWVDVAADAFKARVAELAAFIETSRRDFTEIEAELGWDVVHAAIGSEPYHALIDLISKDFVPKMVEMATRIDSARRLADPARDADLEAYSRALVHGAMIEAPWMRRALEQPFGYPGDYELMRYVYERQFEGPTLFAKSMGYAYLQTAAACAVRERKNLVMRQMTTLLDAWRRPDVPVRILSIAAGPAQEVYELLRNREEMPAPVEIVLFDQDANALAYAYGRIRTLVDTKWRGRVTVTFLHEGIRALIKNPDMFVGVGTFDGIICCGLYDYLNDKVAAGLTSKLYAVLNPGGSVWIGNMVPENPCRWFMEHHQNWRLLYRSRAEILAFARAGVPEASHEILEEPTGVNPFVSVRKT